MSFVQSDPMPARHVFKFAVSGIDLTVEQQQHVSERVARAGVEALASLRLGPVDQVLFDLPEWLGLWLMMIERGRTDEVGLGISGDEIAVQRERLAGLGRES